MSQITLALTLTEFLLRVIPEALILMLGMHAFTKMRIEKKKFFIAALILAVLVFVIRMLPISYGLHTILAIICSTIIVNKIYSVDIVKAIQSIIIISIIQFVSELVNGLWIQCILRKSLDEIFDNPMQKILYGVPSLVIWGAIMIVFYRRNTLKRKKSEG